MADRHNRDLDRQRAPLPEPLPAPTVDAHAHMEIITDTAPYSSTTGVCSAIVSTFYELHNK